MSAVGVAPVVVAVGCDGNGTAVDWAAAEAAARGAALQVVHVLPGSWGVDPFGCVALQGFSCGVGPGRDLLHAAVARARSMDSDLPVSARLLSGSLVPSLLAQGRTAALLVVGGDSGGRRGLRRLSSVARAVAARASCPVAVVRGLRGPGHGLAPRIVVGVDGTPSSTAALDFAVRAAAQRGVPVTAVHAWAPDGLVGHAGVAGSEAGARAVLERVLRHRPERSAGVRVEGRLMCGDPAAALIRESGGAALVVVGSGRRRLFSRLASGSVSGAVSLGAACPAVVVRPETAGHHGRVRAFPPASVRPTPGPLMDRGKTEPARRRRPMWE